MNNNIYTIITFTSHTWHNTHAYACKSVLELYYRNLLMDSTYITHREIQETWSGKCVRTEKNGLYVTVSHFHFRKRTTSSSTPPLQIQTAWLKIYDTGKTHPPSPHWTTLGYSMQMSFPFCVSSHLPRRTSNKCWYLLSTKQKASFGNQV